MNNGITSAAACAFVVASSVAVGSGIESSAVQSIDRYCAASWRQARVPAQDWEDCTQQVFLDLLHRVSRDRFAKAVYQVKSHERRELNRAIWCTVQRWRRTHTHYQLSDGDVPDARQARVEAIRHARETIDDALPELTDRQQKILSHALDGATVAEIAAALDTPASRISDDKYKAIRKLRRRFCSASSNNPGRFSVLETRSKRSGCESRLS